MKVTWTVTPVGYQHIAKRCPSCNVKRDFTPSGAFRVNSQKKMLDVWSIYKCTHCDYTWNIALYSRLPVSKINQELHHRLMTNDESTIRHFAYDTAVLKQNNAELSGQPDFRIQERCQTSITMQYQICVRIRLTHSFQVSLLSILKKQLMLSSADIRRRIDSGQITGVTAKMLKSRKLRQTEYCLEITEETFFARRRIKLIQAK
ncbi:Uncharacterized protein conserved in bacteria [Salmonella enterica subsp. enterica serovar Bovismorbificans]|uniref:Uncharacterized protein conserved in bacteria n=1 Tax=Salmonella enterica subsp. enterica serovar Bovismorbificans TaxID=58097 RepID=A0A655BTB2_SALET|nr:DUF1062 domain-containing protein [Salmonella enterica]CNT76406.1 Uncharacterized protein conserved in bacteria [Salmonella enterica subsp. enterica serovar Bovismorbificans]